MKIWQLEREYDQLFLSVFDLRSKKSRKIRPKVLKIKEMIEKDKERAILELCKKYDGWDKEYPFQLTREEIREGAKSVNSYDLKVLRGMVERVRECHRQRKYGKKVINRGGLRVEEDYVPVEKVLIYAPGGKASYPSSLIMAAVPAQLAHVKEIHVTSPSPGGRVNPYILACAEILGIENVYRLGGAQAIFSFAMGVGGVPKVDMIVGPGNAYVEEAKRECFGSVGIDTIAGPSELLILATEPLFPEIIAKDLLSQAEHDEMAVLWLFSPDVEHIKDVISHLEINLQRSKRKGIMSKVVSERTFFVHYNSRETAISAINRLAPEHLQIIGDKDLKEKVFYSGITYVGISTPTALGDYYIGTNHILPTGGSGRFLGGLSVESFRRKRIAVEVDFSFIERYGSQAERIAEIEGLFCHKEAIRARKEMKHEIEDWVSQR